jgi:hypothetical protein
VLSRAGCPKANAPPRRPLAHAKALQKKLEDLSMRTDLFAALTVAALAVAGGAWAYNRSTGNTGCCLPGLSCCEEDSGAAPKAGAGTLTAAKADACCPDGCCPECLACCAEDGCCWECILCCLEMGCDPFSCCAAPTSAKAEAPRKEACCTAARGCCAADCGK